MLSSPRPTPSKRMAGPAARSPSIALRRGGRYSSTTIQALSSLLSGVEFRKLRPGTVRNIEELEGSIVRAREQGYALVDEEFEFGLVGAAAPVRTSRDGSSPRSTSRRPSSVSVDGWRAAGREVKKGRG